MTDAIPQVIVGLLLGLGLARILHVARIHEEERKRRAEEAQREWSDLVYSIRNSYLV